MSCSRWGLAALLCILAAGCGPREGQPAERLAVPPFEDLSDGATTGWAGRALSEVVATGVAGSPSLHSLRVPSGREAALAGATSVLRGYYVVTDGRIKVKAERQDLGRGRTVSYFSAEEAFPQGLLRAAESLARWIQPGAQAFDTQNPDALRAFAEGRELEDPLAAAAAFERSVSFDPDFGGAYAAWARALLLRGDRAGVEAVIGKARARGDRIREVRRVDLDLIQSAVTNDAALRRKSLLDLARVTPADPDVFRQLAREESAARRYDSAAGFYRRVTALEPRDQAAWNSLGYAEAARRNLDGARSALEEYRRLAPRDANPLDSFGGVHFHLGAFKETDKYYLEVFEKDGRFLGGATLYKAARARLMTGDVSGADGIFRGLQATDSVAACRRAQWLYLTGRKDEAVAEMKRITAPEARPLIEAQLGVWRLLSGSREEAPAASPYARRLALARELADRRFVDAVPVLKELAAAADPVGSDRVAVLLAWAWIETGRIQDAIPLLATYGVPPAVVEDPLIYFAFPRIFELRAAVLERQGQPAEAARMRETYRKLGGG